MSRAGPQTGHKMDREGALSVLDIKTEIARRIERMTSVVDHSLATQGAVQGLDSLWKWIQQSEGGDE